jgi:hypothetical protein
MHPALDPTEQSKRAMRGLAGLVERITPWLVEVGSWILGGLIALNLVIIAALVTVGPVDTAVQVAVTAFACALPLDIAGIVLLRLIKDWRDIRIDDLTLEAFQDAHFPHIEAYFPTARERASLAKRRARIALLYALGIAAASVTLTLVGMTSTLWHMAPSIAETFAATVALSLLLLLVVITQSLPPPSEAEKRLQRRYRDKQGAA